MTQEKNEGQPAAPEKSPGQKPQGRPHRRPPRPGARPTGQQGTRPAGQQGAQPTGQQGARPAGQPGQPSSRPPEPRPEGGQQRKPPQKGQRPPGKPGQQGAVSRKPGQEGVTPQRKPGQDGQRPPRQPGQQGQPGRAPRPAVAGQPGARPLQKGPRPAPGGKGPRPGERPAMPRPGAAKPGTASKKSIQASPQAKEQPQQPPEEVLLLYSVHQLVQRRGVAALVLGAIAAVGYIAYTAYPNVMFGVVATAILIFSVSAFLFPIRYRFTSRGVYFRNFTSNEFREWSRFYDYFIYKDAVLLSFDYRTLRGRIQKGFLVYFDAKQEHKARLLEIISSKISRPARQPSAAKPQRRGLFPLIRRGKEVAPPATAPAAPAGAEAPAKPEVTTTSEATTEPGAPAEAATQPEAAPRPEAAPEATGVEPPETEVADVRPRPETDAHPEPEADANPEPSVTDTGPKPEA